VRRVALLSLSLFWAGCALKISGTGDDFALGDDAAIDSGVVVDDSQVDGDLVDSTAMDSTIDSATIDSTTLDSAIDSEVPDTGPFDTGAPDTGPFDTGAPDTGPFDTGPFDTGAPDMGPEVPATGILTGSGGPASGTINLTTEGTIGWAHWALGMTNDFDRKASADVIGKGGVFGGFAARYGSYPIKFSWSDGTPTMTANTASGYYVTGKDDGFTLDAQGDPAATRTLKVYAAWNNASGTIEASLSDSSAPAWSAPIPPSPSGSSMIEPVVYTIVFKPITAGAKVNVKITKTSSGTNYISLLAATLH
jgi:hypothetical protein